MFDVRPWLFGIFAALAVIWSVIGGSLLLNGDDSPERKQPASMCARHQGFDQAIQQENSDGKNTVTIMVCKDGSAYTVKYGQINA